MTHDIHRLIQLADQISTPLINEVEREHSHKLAIPDDAKQEQAVSGSRSHLSSIR